jgi:site-specific recombinase XerD
MNSRFEQFIQQGIYLRNWSTRTVRTYRQGLKRLPTEIPTKSQLDAWVVQMRQDGLTPGGCNMYIRTINSYLSWLHEGKDLDQPLKVKLLRAPQKQLTLLSDSDIRAILAFRPRNRAQRRTWTLVLLLLDTGIRISEALGIQGNKLDLDQMMVVVFGKGAKERVVPFSHEMRKVLYRWLQSARGRDSSYVFSTYSGSGLTYRNAFRDVSVLMRRVGITKRVHPHLFRHQFASCYVRKGGDIYRLSRLLGHTAVGTTQIYLRSLGLTDLRSGQERLTPLRLGA